jgi:AraC-like DNA-binding protein
VKVGHSHLLENTALESTFVPASLQWAQLEPGHFDIRYAVMDAAPLRVSVRTFNVGFKGEAEVTPQKCVISVLADPRSRARWFGASMDDEHIGITRGSLHVSTEGRGSFFGVVIDEAELQRLFPDAPDALALLENTRNARLIRDPINAERLRALVRLGFRDAIHWRGFTKDPALKSVSGTLTSLLATATESVEHHRVQPTKCLSRRFEAIRRCETYMREHADETLTLLELSRLAGMRSRSLINAFEAITGYSPMDYLKRLRLDGVHRMLNRADKSRTRIIDVATEWGFWHMGHFTSDYRVMFGETPSQTLLKSPN